MNTMVDIPNNDMTMGDMGLDDTNLDLDVVDDFDADQLLRGPLFNDSAEKLSASLSNEASFGNFAVDPEEDLLPKMSSGIPVTVSETCSSDEFDARPRNMSSDHSFCSSQADHDLKPVMPSQAVPEMQRSPQNQMNQGVVGGNISAVPPATLFQGMTISNDELSPRPLPPAVSQQQLHQPSIDANANSNKPPTNVFVNPMSEQPSFDEDTLSQCEPNPIATPNNGSNFGSSLSTPQRSIPERSSSSNSFHSTSLMQQHQQQTSPLRRSPMAAASAAGPRRGIQASTSFHPGQASSSMLGGLGGAQVPLRSQSCNTNGMVGASSSNKLQLMQQHLAKMRELEQLEQMQRRPNSRNNMGGLSQSMHAGGNSSNATMTNSSMSSRYGNNDALGLSQSSHSPTSPAFGNVSIASDVQAMKGSGPNGTDNPASVNDVMEKLCESMKRSAMSRSMIKQFSGRNLSKQGSSRQLPSRQNSGRQLPSRNNSGHGLEGMMPIRRQSSFKKHTLQHPTRGVYRHDSQRSLGGHSNHGGGSISLQIDGRNMGTL